MKWHYVVAPYYTSLIRKCHCDCLPIKLFKDYSLQEFLHITSHHITCCDQLGHRQVVKIVFWWKLLLFRFRVSQSDERNVFVRYAGHCLTCSACPYLLGSVRTSCVPETVFCFTGSHQTRSQRKSPTPRNASVLWWHCQKVCLSLREKAAHCPAQEPPKSVRNEEGSHLLKLLVLWRLVYILLLSLCVVWGSHCQLLSLWTRFPLLVGGNDKGEGRKGERGK
jgi:hypothetical protein